MNFSTKIKRVDQKLKIIEAMEPVTLQIAKPYNPGKITEVLNTFYKELDKILKIKLEA